MIKRKKLKTRGKLSLSIYFQELKNGDKVAIVREQALNPSFPIRIQGKTGVVTGTKGSAYLIKIRDGESEKVYVIQPAHLKKIK